jgi:hypothetical protein
MIELGLGYFYAKLENERPRGKPRGIQERNPQEHTQQAAGYSSSRERGINFFGARSES